MCVSNDIHIYWHRQVTVGIGTKDEEKFSIIINEDISLNGLIRR